MVRKDRGRWCVLMIRLMLIYQINLDIIFTRKDMRLHMKSMLHTQKLFMTIIVLSAIFISSITMFSCAGLSDWEYELPNNYFVLRLNTTSINISIKDGKSSYSTIIETYVTCFAYNDRFVCARRLVLPENVRFYDELIKLDFEEALYYIIDTNTGYVYESLTEKDYNEKCKQLNIINLCDWIATSGKPR